jgi:hypothetical protein
MGRIRKTLAWTFSPGGNMHGLVRAESSAEKAAREAGEAQQAHAQEQLRMLKGQQAQAREQLRLLEEQNRLLAEQNRLHQESLEENP